MLAMMTYMNLWNIYTIKIYLKKCDRVKYTHDTRTPPAALFSTPLFDLGRVATVGFTDYASEARAAHPR